MSSAGSSARSSQARTSSPWATRPVTRTDIVDGDRGTPCLLPYAQPPLVAVSQPRKGFHTSSPITLYRGRETPWRLRKRWLRALCRQKTLRGKLLDLRWREATGARPVEQYELAVPSRNLDVREEDDELHIIGILGDVRCDVGAPSLYLDENRMVSAIRAQVSSLAATQRELLSDIVAMPFQEHPQFVLPVLMFCATSARPLEHDAARREQSRSVRREREEPSRSSRRSPSTKR